MVIVLILAKDWFGIKAALFCFWMPRFFKPFIRLLPLAVQVVVDLYNAAALTGMTLFA